MLAKPGSDVALGILGAAIAVAGLILIYTGFLSGKGAQFEGSKRGDKYFILARLGIIPVLFGFLVAAMGARALQGDHWGSDWCAYHLLLAFFILLALSAAYAILGAFVGT